MKYKEYRNIDVLKVSEPFNEIPNLANFRLSKSVLPYSSDDNVICENSCHL